ncbi:MAG: hypothetical protein DRO90_03300, partial [Candidatus Altiarchaeales archaeon]
VRSCFDILARRDDTILLIKILPNIEGLNHKSALELKNVAVVMSGIPLIIGDHTKNSILSPDVIYTRYDIHVVNIDAFAGILSGRIPSIYSIRGNYCMRIDSRLLSNIRKKLNMTQEELAYQLGVSKQSIYRYESSGRISLNIAEKLMEFLKEDIMVPSDIFTLEINCLENEISTFMTDLKRMVLREFKNIGLDTSLTNAPFDILAREREHHEKILTIVSDDREGLKRKVEIIKDISEITGGYKVCISNRARDLDVLVIRPKELSEIKEVSEFMELLVD